MALRAVIFGLRNVVLKVGNLDPFIVQELRKLFNFLRAKNIEPILLGNDDWVLKDTDTGQTSQIDDHLLEIYGPHRLYITKRMGLPEKPKKDAVDHILQQHNLSNEQVIYVGNTPMDFRTAINSNLLFLNETWETQQVSYGFTFSTPKEVGRFINAFALKEHPWFYAIDRPGLEYRSLAPFSTFAADYEVYSSAARMAAKSATSERHFFLNSLIASIYFSGLIPKIDYIACVPGHNQGYGNPAMNDVLDTMAKCFRKSYLPDLIIRYTGAPSSRELRIQRSTPSPLTQLNTICLTATPLRGLNGKRYKNPLNLHDKTVLLFDDFCTAGYSLEAARLFLRQAGARVIEVSWLKTINTGYNQIEIKRDFDPYRHQQFEPTDISIRHSSYREYIVDPAAPKELTAAYNQYRNWNFPPEC